MKRIFQKTRIHYLTEKRNSYLFLAVGSIMVNILLAIYINSVGSNEKIHFIPPVNEKPFWISSREVSPEYLSSMSIFLGDLLLNITPANAQMKHRLFLRYVDERFYEHFKVALLSEEERLKKEHMTTHFQLANVEVDAKKFIARMTGDVIYTVGEAILPAKRLAYEIKFNYHLGLLHIKSFEEVKPNA